MGTLFINALLLLGHVGLPTASPELATAFQMMLPPQHAALGVFSIACHLKGGPADACLT